MFKNRQVRLTLAVMVLFVVPLIAAGCGGGTPDNDMADPGGLEGLPQDGVGEPPAADDGVGFDMDDPGLNDQGFDDPMLDDQFDELEASPFDPGAF